MITTIRNINPPLTLSIVFITLTLFMVRSVHCLSCISLALCCIPFTLHIMYFTHPAYLVLLTSFIEYPTPHSSGIPLTPTGGTFNSPCLSYIRNASFSSAFNDSSSSSIKNLAARAQNSSNSNSPEPEKERRHERFVGALMVPIVADDDDGNGDNREGCR